MVENFVGIWMRIVGQDVTSERGTPASRGRALVFEIDERVRIVGGVRHTRHPAHPLALVCAGRERETR